MLLFATFLPLHYYLHPTLLLPTFPACVLFSRLIVRWFFTLTFVTFVAVVHTAFAVAFLRTLRFLLVLYARFTFVRTVVLRWIADVLYRTARVFSCCCRLCVPGCWMRWLIYAVLRSVVVHLLSRFALPFATVCGLVGFGSPLVITLRAHVLHSTHAYTRFTTAVLRSGSRRLHAPRVPLSAIFAACCPFHHCFTARFTHACTATASFTLPPLYPHVLGLRTFVYSSTSLHHHAHGSSRLARGSRTSRSYRLFTRSHCARCLLAPLRAARALYAPLPHALHHASLGLPHGSPRGFYHLFYARTHTLASRGPLLVCYGSVLVLLPHGSLYTCRPCLPHTPHFHTTTVFTYDSTRLFTLPHTHILPAFADLRTFVTPAGSRRTAPRSHTLPHLICSNFCDVTPHAHTTPRTFRSCGVVILHYTCTLSPLRV